MTDTDPKVAFPKSRDAKFRGHGRLRHGHGIVVPPEGGVHRVVDNAESAGAKTHRPSGLKWMRSTVAEDGEITRSRKVEYKKKRIF
jgi:hypothetical protein